MNEADKYTQLLAELSLQSQHGVFGAKICSPESKTQLAVRKEKKGHSIL